MTGIAGVFACILLLHPMDQQLSSCAFLHHLILGTGKKLQGALAPLHAHSCLAKLTAQVCGGPFIYFLGLQLPEEPHRSSCKVEEQIRTGPELLRVLQSGNQRALLQGGTRELRMAVKGVTVPACGASREGRVPEGYP